MGLTKKEPSRKKKSGRIMNRRGARLTIRDADGVLREYRAAVVPGEDGAKASDRKEAEE